MSYKTLDNQLSPELEELLKPVMKEVKYTDTVFNKTCGGEAMSEDVKPRIVQISVLNGPKGHKEIYLSGINYKPKEFPEREVIELIEMEPTLKIMDDMSKALSSVCGHSEDCMDSDLDEKEFSENETCECDYIAIKRAKEKYKKFKDGLK